MLVFLIYLFALYAIINDNLQTQTFFKPEVKGDNSAILTGLSHTDRKKQIQGLPRQKLMVNTFSDLTIYWGLLTNRVMWLTGY